MGGHSDSAHFACERIPAHREPGPMDEKRTFMAVRPAMLGSAMRNQLEKRLAKYFKQTIFAGVVLGLSGGFAVFTSNGMPGNAMWSATRIPTTAVASIAAIAVASSGSKALWTKKELSRLQR